MSSDKDGSVPEPVEPSRSELREAVGAVRTDGLYDPKKPPTAHGVLVQAAGHVSSKPDDAAKIKDALEKAIEDIGGEDTEALQVLFGLTDDLAGRDIDIAARRRKAMALTSFSGKSLDSFRKSWEKDWIQAIAGWLERFSKPVAERATRKDQPEPPEPDEPPQERRPTWEVVRDFVRRRAPVLLAVVGVAAIGAAIALLSNRSRSNADAVAGRCGPTTVQLVTNTEAEILMYAPGAHEVEHGWLGHFASAQGEIVRYGEVRQFAMQSTNETSETKHKLIARIGLTQSVKLVPNTTCVYRPGHYTRGFRHAGTELAGQSGIKIGSLAPHEKVDVTFMERMPTGGLPGNIAKTYGAIAPETEIDGPEWTDERAALVELELGSKG